MAKKENQAVVVENYSPSGAIARAKMLSERKPFRDEAYQLFGLQLWSYQEDTYLQFRERLLANSQLNSALQNAKKEEVSVFLDNELEFGAGWVEINTDATDEEIIKFLSSSVAVAKAKWVELENLRKEASQYGLYIQAYYQIEEYKKMKGRLLSNEDLASALRAAAHEKITVFLDNKFLVEKGFVSINVDAVDEEIIKFLLGK